MDSPDAIVVLTALGQATRLDAFRLLVSEGPEGLAASDIAARLDVPRNTMSGHLGILANAGLVSSERRSKQIFYRADIHRLARLTEYLVENCCGGRSELCEPDLSLLRTLDRT
jgi:DNA-binding transcriptional ArsR family regulator